MAYVRYEVDVNQAIYSDYEGLRRENVGRRLSRKEADSLLESCDPNNEVGHRSRSHHTEAELHSMWSDGTHFYMRWGMGCVSVSKTKYLYRQFIIEKGYITDKD